MAARYTEAFADEPRIELPVPRNPSDRHAWHLFAIRLNGVDRDAFIRGMTDRGIGTSVHFIPLHVHPYWRDRYGWVPEDFPVAMDAFRRSVSLPIYPRMADADVDRVIEAVRASLDAA
jgi:dTDP-4-amino-4,6-dideoxygalactose transaminase